MNLAKLPWLQKLLGFDTSNVPPGAEVNLVWSNMPQSWGVFLVIGAVLLGFYIVRWLYRHELDTCPAWVKRVLVGLRVAVLLVLLAVYLGPAAISTIRTSLPSLIVLLRDDSRSMAQRDVYLDDDAAQRVAKFQGSTVEKVRADRPSRASLVEEAFEKDNRQLLRELEERGRLRVLDFSTRVKPVVERAAIQKPAREEKPKAGEIASDDAQTATTKDAIGSTEKPEDDVTALPALDASGQGTDLYKAIRDGIADKMTAVTILFADGQHTATGDLQAAAAEAKEKGIPLLIVGVGDPSRPRNLQISDVYADPQVWRDDPFEIQAVLRAQGVGAQQVEVVLVQREVREGTAEPGEEQILERREVELPPDGGQVRLSFQHTAEKPGRLLFSVRVQQLENESNLEDNEPTSPVPVKVLGEQARVLLVAGAPTWEYRGVQRLLTREKSIDLSCWLQTLDDGRPQEGDTPITLLPATREALFKYDVVLLFDPDPKEFDNEWVELLKQFVGEHSGGMLYMAGPKYSGRFLAGARTGELKDLLPVRLGDVARMEVDQLVAATTSRSWPLGVVSANVDQPIMRFYPEPEKTLARWQSLPGIFWSFPSEEPKAAARMLIELSDPAMIGGPRPLLVTGQYGSGRTVYVGFNGTWRWRRIGHDAEYFNRFWVQTVRYLIEGRSLEGKRRGIVEAERARYDLGERVQITAQLKDSSYKPLEVPVVNATRRHSDGEIVPFTLAPIPNQPGSYEATITPHRTGRYTIVVEPPAETVEAVNIETNFSVTLPSAEANEAWLNKAQLVSLAEESGGKYFSLDELDKLVAAIPDKTKHIDLQSKPLPLWDTRNLLFLLVGLLCVEWAVRKKYKLM